MRDICDVYAHGCVIWSSPRSAERTERTVRHPHVVQHTHTHTTTNTYTPPSPPNALATHLASSSCSAQRNDVGDDAQRRRSHNNEVECVHLMDCHIRGVNSHARCVRCTHLHTHTHSRFSLNSRLCYICITRTVPTTDHHRHRHHHHIQLLCPPLTTTVGARRPSL